MTTHTGTLLEVRGRLAATIEMQGLNIHMSIRRKNQQALAKLDALIAAVPKYAETMPNSLARQKQKYKAAELLHQATQHNNREG